MLKLGFGEQLVGLIMRCVVGLGTCQWSILRIFEDGHQVVGAGMVSAVASLEGFHLLL
jgi:hypothetical protein